MSDQSDLISLYSRRILALASDVPHAERLADPQASATKRSPLCGSTVTVDVAMDGDKITDFGQDVKACALGQASASVLGHGVIGASVCEISEARDTLHAMLKSGGEPPAQGRFTDLEVLRPARDYKNRHASILLAWDALVEAIESIGATACAEG